MNNIFNIYLIPNETAIYNIALLISLFFIYSFSGWFMESVLGYFIFNKKKFINRGFLIGPICPVYGCGVVLVTMLLTKYKEDFIVFYVLATVICGVLEYFTSFIMEKLFNARWWDYHNKKFNINGRICLETLLPFGIGASLIMYFFNPLIIKLLSFIPVNVLYIIIVFLILLGIIDVIISLFIINSFKGFIYKEKDNTEEISTKVKEKAEEIEEGIKKQSGEIIMAAEATALHAIRKNIVKAKLYNRKIKFTRKHFVNRITEFISINKQAISNRINERKVVIHNYIVATQEKRYNIQSKSIEKLKASKERLQAKVSNITDKVKMSSEEFTKHVKEKFAETSILRRRLVEAFPNIEIKVNDKNGKSKRSKK